MAEGLCGAYAHEYHVPVKTARLAQTFGAGIFKAGEPCLCADGAQYSEG